MKLIYLFLAIVISFGLSACNSATSTPQATTFPVKPTSTHPAFTPIATNILTATPIPSSTSLPKEWLPYNPNPSNQGCDEFTATIPETEVQTLSNTDIARKLFEMYLAHYKSSGLGGVCKLEDFKMEGVKNDTRISFLAKEQKVDYIITVQYSVQIKEVPSDWVAGNGELAAEGWIVHKGLIIGVTKVNDQYFLKLIGTGP